MKHISVLIKPASSLCNLRCKYCFYANVSDLRQVRSYGIIQPETSRRIVENIFSVLEDGDLLTLAFQGGEPSVAGLPCLEQFVSCVSSQPKKVQVEYAFQTNGTLLDDSWCEFLKKHNFLVGLSLDGPARFHNANRVDANGQGTFREVMETKRRLDRYGIEYNVLCVLTNELARHPGQIWKFLLDNRIRYVQFIPCLDELEPTGSPYALTPRRFHSFCSALYRLWHDTLMEGTYISVKLFDDIANLFLYRRVTACGITGQCSMQYVTEADGSVYPCDFYVLDQYKLGDLTRDPLPALWERYRSSGFQCSRGRLPDGCTGCRYQNACGGGCKRMERSMYIDGDFCGYRALLDDILDPLCRDARMLARS